MSWICKRCETENPDAIDICEVCDTHAPRIKEFSYDKILSDTPITIRWVTEFCDNVAIVYCGEQIDVTGEDSFEIAEPNEEDVVFLLNSDDTTTRTQCFKMEFLDKPDIEFTADRYKLRRGKDISVVLSWNITNCLSAILRSKDDIEKIREHDNKKILLNEDSLYLIEVTALDGETIFKKEVSINIYDECEIDFSADKYYIFPTIPVILTWGVNNAKKVWLDGEEVEAIGSKVIEPRKGISCILSAEDEFGIKEKRIDIGMLPIPQVKTLLVPTPKIVNNMSITVKQPRYNTNVKIPKIDIDWISAEVPKVPFLSELGLNVELSPPLPKTTIMSSMRKVFNHIIRK